MAFRPRNVAKELALLIKGEIEVRDFPWLTEQERQELGVWGMAMLKQGDATSAQSAFRVMIDLEPEVALHHLMIGHTLALQDDVRPAFESFSRSIQLSALDDDNQDVASEAFLARGDLMLRLGRVVEARADLADAAKRMEDPIRRKSLEVFLAA